MSQIDTMPTRRLSRLTKGRRRTRISLMLWVTLSSASSSKQYTIQLWILSVALGPTLRHARVPSAHLTDALVLAVGRVGATVMPQVLFPQSGH